MYLSYCNTDLTVICISGVYRKNNTENRDNMSMKTIFIALYL